MYNVYTSILTGGVIVLFAVTLLVASRRLELNVLRNHGLHSHLHYAKYIQVPFRSSSCVPDTHTYHLFFG